MTIRPLEPRDIPRLAEIARANGYEYPADLKSPDIEAVLVVEDAMGNLVAAAAARRISELYLYPNDGHSPVTKMAALRMLHTGMARELRAKGYRESNIFLPPRIEQTFGRRLTKSFSWQWNWRSLFLRF